MGFIVLLLCWCMGATIRKLCFLFCFGFANAWRFDPKKTNWVDLLIHEANNSILFFFVLLMFWDLTFNIQQFLLFFGKVRLRHGLTTWKYYQFFCSIDAWGLLFEKSFYFFKTMLCMGIWFHYSKCDFHGYKNRNVVKLDLLFIPFL